METPMIYRNSFLNLETFKYVMWFIIKTVVGTYQSLLIKTQILVFLELPSSVTIKVERLVSHDWNFSGSHGYEISGSHMTNSSGAYNCRMPVSHIAVRFQGLTWLWYFRVSHDCGIPVAHMVTGSPALGKANDVFVEEPSSGTIIVN